MKPIIVSALFGEAIHPIDIHMQKQRVIACIICFTIR
jgi:hypothetical protein